MTAPMYAQLDSAESVRLAFENGRTVEHGDAHGNFTTLASEPSAEEIEKNLAAGHTYRAVHRVVG